MCLVCRFRLSGNNATLVPSGSTCGTTSSLPCTTGAKVNCRWQSGGVEALANQPKSGRPPKADDAYSLALVEVLEKEPSEVGYDFTIWTVERLSAHLEKVTGIALSESRLRALIKRKGYRYRRPKHDLGHLQDKQAKSNAAEVLEELKKRSAETISNSSLWTKRP